MRVLDADPAFKKKAAVASDRRCRGPIPSERNDAAG